MQLSTVGTPNEVYVNCFSTLANTFSFFLISGSEKVGTTVKFMPPIDVDSGNWKLKIRLQCISAMKEYESKSLEVHNTLELVV